MLVFLVAAALPGLFVEAGPSALPDLKKAGIDCVAAAPAVAAEWKKAGACSEPLDPETLKKLPAPGVQYRMNVASATTAPWVNSNGWQYVRGLATPAYVIVSGQNSAALAAAEAHAFGGMAVVNAPVKEWAALGEMQRFLAKVSDPRLQPVANIGFVDDGSAAAGEDLNLLLRRNLMTAVVKSPNDRLDLNVEPKKGDPSAFAYEVRKKLGDEKRLLRLYGSDVVVGRLFADGARRRVSLLNYGPRPVEGLRVRVLGKFSKVQGAGAAGPVEVRDLTNDGTATEFSLPAVPVYTVLDLQP